MAIDPQKPPRGCDSWLDFVVGGPVLTEGAHAAARADLAALREENAALRETVEILGDPETLKNIERGLADIKAGRVHDHDDVVAELG